MVDNIFGDKFYCVRIYYRKRCVIEECGIINILNFLFDDFILIGGLLMLVIVIINCC